MRAFSALLGLILLAGCAGPVRRPEPVRVYDPGSEVSAAVASWLSGRTGAEAITGPGGAPSGIGMTHTAGAAGSPSGAGNATGAASPAAGVSTLVIGNVAIIGISTEALPAGAADSRLASGVRARVNSRFPQYDAVFVTTDAAQVARIARIHQRMRSGTPATELMDEIQGVVQTVR